MKTTEDQEAAIWATVYAAIMGTTHQGASMYKIDSYETRNLAVDEAAKAVAAWREFTAIKEQKKEFPPRVRNYTF